MRFIIEQYFSNFLGSVIYHFAKHSEITAEATMNVNWGAPCDFNLASFGYVGARDRRRVSAYLFGK